MRVFVSAAEISSDLQAEKILREFTKLYPAGSLEIAGIGGPRLRSLSGFQAIEDAENLRAMGFTEVLVKFFKIKKILNHAVSFLETYKPDLILTFDYPDFHFALLQACAKNPVLSKAKKICGIPPKVWVWRSKRIEKIRTFYDAVWVLFPFEKAIYEEAGIPAIYEGNPLIADVVSKGLPKKPEWQNDDSITLAVMPGSRDAEITEHLKVIPLSLELLSQRCKKRIIAEIPVPQGINPDSISKKLKESSGVSYRFFEDGSHGVLSRNSLGLIKSGTSTLEAAVAGCVPVIFYRVSFISRLIFQYVVRYSGAVGLPNILLGVKKRKNAIFPELLGPEATPEALCDALFLLIRNEEELTAKKLKGEELRHVLVPTSDIPAKIAARFKNVLETQKIECVHRRKRAMIAIISFGWSSLNFLRRKLYSLGIFKAHLISLPSVLIGNLQAGGAGKTPLVIEVAREAVRRGYRVGVVSRAYGVKLDSPLKVVSQRHSPELMGRADQIGDEPAEIIAEVPEVILGLGRDRVEISKILEREGANFLVFDDGFQNLKFKTSKTLLAVTDAGPSEVVFRDFFSQSSFAHMVVQTKGFPRKAPIPALGLSWEMESELKSPIWLVCAVGDPLEIEQFYRNRGVEIDRVIALPDHAKIDLIQWKLWEQQALRSQAVLAVTPKDWVKLKSDSSLTPVVLRRKINNAQGWLEPIFRR